MESKGKSLEQIKKSFSVVSEKDRRRFLGQASEKKVLNIIRALGRSGKTEATQSEIVSRTELPLNVVRQILRRFRRSGYLRVYYLEGKGNKKIRAYKLRKSHDSAEVS